MTVVYVGLGANLGNREANLRMALAYMTRMGRLTAVSSLYETEPIGVGPQPAFYNAACAFETGLDPLPLLRFLQGIEREIGRRPGSERDQPRPIDLDILLYGDAVVEEQHLVVPHARMEGRAFVLVPLAEIAGSVSHPKLARTIADLAKDAGASGIKRLAKPGWDRVVGREERGVLGRGPAT
jgi:2-amino-4-hydroxy-6-hydroxymethyldihydropteridine diphosphokinase